MENNVPSLLHIDINFVVANVGKISKDFTEPLDLPSNLIELIFRKYLSCNAYISEREVAYFFTQKAQFNTIDFSSSLYVTNSWINFLPSTILSLDVSNCTNLTDEGLLKIVTILPNLTELKINECINISEKCWTCVSSLTRLQVFEASSTQLGDEALTALAQSCSNMRVLNLSFTRVFKAISEIKHLTQLVDLDLDQTRITPGAVIDLCKALKQLRRFKADIFDDLKFNSVYSHLPESLETLELDGLPNGVPSVGFSHLTALQRMDLKCWHDGNTFSIENLTRLTRIRVDAQLSGTTSYDWSKMKCIKSWDWDTQADATSLVNCTRVRAGNFPLPENLPYLTNLVTIRWKPTEGGIELMKKLSNLKKIYFGYEPNLDFADYIRLFQQMEITCLESSDFHPTVSTLTSLEKLSLFGSDPIDIGYGLLRNLTALEATTVPLEHIATLTKLKHLDIRYALDNRIEVLTSLTNLTYLDIGGLAFSDDRFAALTNHLTNLKNLLLMDVPNTEPLIPSFTKLKRLQTLLIDVLPSAESLKLLSELPSLNKLQLCSRPEVVDEALLLMKSSSLCSLVFQDGQINDNVAQQFADAGIHFIE
jgi:hypothetical protein